MLEKQLKRLKRKNRIAANLAGTNKPRLSVYRSNTFIYAQVIDLEGKVICATSDIKVKGKLTKSESSKKVGEEIAKKALEAKVTEVVFDRNGFAYHGRVKALAEAAREAGLKF
ncbi:50S ribosomal protein L18 [Candidatus Gracilibacteria bacterium]|nr:50S ribosomal protein L18 [Candidatus Gracilibacteria bacterium]